MSDRWFFSLSALAAVLMVALALVWPQGLGKRSPRPFGHIPAYEAEAAAKAAKSKSAPPPRTEMKGPF